ncbi:MAG: GNAT family N-acetyltransferase [Oscillospiraceae bacterium]|nr:GNAT family N-acetyltransferase [Oscillospiraceae bacterium]
MSIIKTHDVTLYGSSGNFDIVLHPLCDENLPLLYKWNADPEVLYWSEGDDVIEGYDTETINDIYGGVSQNAFCFLVEANNKPIGECWLQKMNMPEVIKQYPAQDVRRIDMIIGEKEYWGKGIGSAFISMLIDLAFFGEYIDVLHCFTYDNNIRSLKAFLKNGFKEVKRIPTTNSSKHKEEIHLALTRQQFIEHHRTKVSSDKIFELPIDEIQPSQLYISDGKLKLVHDWFIPSDKSVFDPIPVKLYNNNYLMTDGHTRIVAAVLAGWETVPVTWDDDPLDMLAYALCVDWCNEAGIKNATDLTKRIISFKEYETLWRKRCQNM